MRKVVEEGADLGIAWDGDADRCFFIDDTRRVRRRRLPHRAAGRVAARKQPGRGDPLRRPRQPRRRRHRRARPAARAHPNRVGHAFFKTRMRDEGAMFGGEVSGHYYFRDFYCADSGTIPALLILELLSSEGEKLSRAARRATARSTSSPARSTPRSTTQHGEDGGDRGALRRRARSTTSTASRSTTTTGTSTCALQHRAAAAPVPGVARLARGHGAPARRGARDHPLVSDAAGAARWRAPPTPASTAWPIPTPFPVGRVNTYLIEDDPLTLRRQRARTPARRWTRSSARSPRTATASRTSS